MTRTSSAGTGGLRRALTRLRRAALKYPGAVEEFPWGEHALKVNKKVFVFLSLHNKVLRVTVKLPQSGKSALSLPFTAPTGYGLGKSGWVTAGFEPGDKVDVDLLKEWIDESYRTIAPNKYVKQLDED
jgi:predicted DNA-binding protein (MmcQ/YjbR family)